jgi:hypothetical protein
MLTSAIFGFLISVLFPQIQNILLLGNTIPMGGSTSSNVSDTLNIFAKQQINSVPF